MLGVWGYRHGLLGLRDLVRSAHPGFAIWVLALGVVVAGLGVGFLGDAIEHLVPDSVSLGGIVLIAVIATVLANLLTNLSATLLIVPILAPLGTTAVLAALLGLNIGSGLTLDRVAGQPAVAPHPDGVRRGAPAARRTTGSRSR